MGPLNLRGLKSAALTLVLLAGAVLFGVVVHGHYPIQTWLFWRYLGYWTAAAVWAGSCLVLGYALLGYLPGGAGSRRERLTLGLAVGVLAFGLCVFALGLARGLNQVTFFVLPLAFYAVGARRFVQDWPPLRETLASWGLDRIPLWWLPVLAVGFSGTAVLYLQALSPENFSFDVRWYHLPMAQRYALSGGIARSAEGFWMSAYPQLATYLYTWVFMAPKLVLFDRLELCAHLEFMLFLATLAQIVLFVRVLIPESRSGLAWVALFLFPKIYLYDSNLHAGADHIAAFWAIPIALTFLRAWRAFQPTPVLLFALFVSAAALTKYTAIIIVLPPALALFARGLFLTLKQRNLKVGLALTTLVFAPLLLTAAHWFKNWLWYGDPIFPLLHARLNVHPWTPDAATQIKLLEGVARPGSLTRSGLWEALRATVAFPFEANDWYDLGHNVPVFGAAFVLLLPCLLFTRGASRIAWLYAHTLGAVFLWYLLSHYERFLQAVLPWMASATAAAVILVWKSGWLARAAVVPVLALQVIWGGDVPFFRTHNLIGDSPLRKTTQFLASGFEKTANRLSVYEPLSTVGRAIPADGVVLAHDVIMILGIDRNWITDLHQTKISYGRLRTPSAIHKELVQLGVTHLVWPEWSMGRDSFAGDLAFANYAVNHTTNRRQVGGYAVARLPPSPPLNQVDDYDVAFFGCGGPYANGWYRLSQLTRPVIGAITSVHPVIPLGTMQEALRRASMIVVDKHCQSERPDSSFQLGLRRASHELYVKRSVVEHP